MKKFIQKYSIPIVLTVIFSFLLFYGINLSVNQIQQANQAQKVYPSFVVETTDSTQTISLFDDGNGNLYVFLPSHADMTKVSVRYESSAELFIDDTLVANGTNCSSFELETPYNYEFQQHKSTIHFCKSANIATLDLSTSSGTLEHIHNDKSYSESVSFVMYTQDGKIDCSDGYSHLKGRGNSTWTSEKKPYVLTLSADKEILGMSASSSWILLSSGINNKLVYDFARKLDFGWSPDTRFVNLYINSEYRGMYLLSEKIEIAENKLDIENANGFYCKNEPAFREPRLNNPFTTESGRMVEINLPKHFSSSDLNNAHLLINELEKAIFSGKDLSLNPIFDLDSWVYKYLIDEVFANTDSDIASSYFYYSNGSFKGGPIWDYDGTLGVNPNHQFPNSQIATNPIKAKNQTSLYYGALYQNASFYNRVVELYQENFLPLLEELTSHGMHDLFEETSAATRLNNLRWTQTSNEDLSNYNSIEEKRIAYLKERIDFLSDIWINKTPYRTIRFRPDKIISDGWSDIYISIKEGDTLNISEYPLLQTEWIIDETGEKMDFSKPITSDYALINATVYSTITDTTNQTDSESIPTIILLTVSALFVFFVIALAINFIRSRKQRRSYDADK